MGPHENSLLLGARAIVTAKEVADGIDVNSHPRIPHQSSNIVPSLYKGFGEPHPEESLPLLPADFTKGPYAVEKTFSFHCVLSPVLTSKGNYVLQRLSSLVMTQIPLNKLTYERCPCIPHARLMRGDEYVIQIP